MARKYLDKLFSGDKNTDHNIIFPNAEFNVETDKFLKQRKVYGYDERETYCLDFTAACWIYEHLQMYKEFSIVDTDVVNVDIPVLHHSGKLDFKELNTAWYAEKLEKHTMSEAINLCIKYLEDYLTSEKVEDEMFENNIPPKQIIAYEQCSYEKLTGAIRIFAVIINHLSW